MKDKYKLIFGICFYTSCRISEALKLDVKDIDAEYITFHAKNTKTNEIRQVFVHPELREMINNYSMPAEGYVFPAPTKQGHIIRQSADRELRRVCEIIGIEGASSHSFRRTGITTLFNFGEELKTIQGYTGHKSLAVLNGYIEVEQKKVNSAVLRLTLKELYEQVAT